MSALQNIHLHKEEPPYSESLGSKNPPEAFTLLEKNNCTIHIILLYIVLAISTVITITAVYTNNSFKLVEPVDKEASVRVVFENGPESPFDCNLKNSSSKGWYFPSQYNPSYMCDPFKTVSNINIQPLNMRRRECNDTDHCHDTIRTYLGIVEKHSRFGYFIDNDANVYGGRGWSCEFLGGQMWVGVMVGGFGAASQTEKDRILHHFREEVIPYANHCVVAKPDLKFHYFQEIVV